MIYLAWPLYYRSGGDMHEIREDDTDLRRIDVD
jgi:hypothetical protein